MDIKSFLVETKCVPAEDGNVTITVDDQKLLGEKPAEEVIVVLAKLVRAALLNTSEIQIFGTGNKTEPYSDRDGNTLLASTGPNRVHFLDNNLAPHSAANFPFEELKSFGVTLHPQVEHAPEKESV